ncbi:MAG: hypothetical protein ACXWG1_01110 [Usitatibacter sp.]
MTKKLSAALRAWLLLAVSLALSSCAGAPVPNDGFAFGVIGDAPYNVREEGPFDQAIDRMNAQPLAFVVHVGDIKAGSNSPCTDALFGKRRAAFERSEHPFIYSPGDNEWTDCRRATNGAMDPLERLAKLRQVFFPRGRTLGRRSIDTAFQEGFPENRSWEHKGVRVVTLNFPGPDNNEGHGAATDEEARARMDANLRWLERSVKESEDPATRGLVVATQANPWTGKQFAPFLHALTAAAKRLGKPVLFVHGDTHIYRFDTPFVDDKGAPLANPARLETYGSPFVGWEKVTVDPGDPKLFSVEPMLQAIVR